MKKEYTIRWNVKGKVAEYYFSDRYTQEDAARIAENLNRANPGYYYEVVAV